VSNLLSLIPNDWQVFLSDYFVSRDWQQLCDAFDQEYQMRGQFIRPDKELLFNALKLTPVSEVKVILLGQDPYHSPGLAQGLAFSIPRDIALRSKQFPSSLRNINKALQIEGFGSLENGDLSHWAKQGVLLLNTALSVRLGEAGSHSQLGIWSGFSGARMHSRLRNTYAMQIIIAYCVPPIPQAWEFIKQCSHLFSQGIKEVVGTLVKQINT